MTEPTNEIVGALDAAAGVGAAVGAHVARGTITDALHLTDGDALPVMAVHMTLEALTDVIDLPGEGWDALREALADALTHRAAVAAGY